MLTMEVISYAVWLYFRLPLSLRMVEEMLAARGVLVSHETVRQWALKGTVKLSEKATSIPGTGLNQTALATPVT